MIYKCGGCGFRHRMEITGMSKEARRQLLKCPGCGGQLEGQRKRARRV